MKTFGQRVKELRDAQDLSLREFAKKLGGLSAAFLSDVELGHRFPKDELLAKMAHVLGTTVDDLKSHDMRAPVEDLKRRAASDPVFGFALRKVLEKDVSADQLIELAKKVGQKKKK